MSLLRKPQAGSVLHQITPENANWKYIGFEVRLLKAGESFTWQALPDKERCFTILTGKVNATTEALRWENIGGRKHVFEDASPAAIYLPPHKDITIEALTDCEIAVSSAPAEGKFPARLINPEEMKRSVRGHGSNTRYICDILPESAPYAEALLVVEVITPAGNTSSYPPHKHDQQTENETLLEETYYHRLNPEQGFAFQRVYTDDRSLDETMAVENRDVVLVPKGYHPCGTVHGYDLYYLNTMAGPERRWKFHNDPAHEWLFNP